MYWSIIVRAWRVDYGHNQLVINYQRIGDCMGNNVGLLIPWAIENPVICTNGFMRYVLILHVRGLNLNALTEK